MACREREGAANREGEKEDKGAHKDAGPAPSGAQEQPGTERVSESALSVVLKSVFQI